MDTKVYLYCLWGKRVDLRAPNLHVSALVGSLLFSSSILFQDGWYVPHVRAATVVVPPWAWPARSTYNNITDDVEVDKLSIIIEQRQS